MLDSYAGEALHAPRGVAPDGTMLAVSYYIQGRNSFTVPIPIRTVNESPCLTRIAEITIRFNYVESLRCETILASG
jgi:hypothetical protein